MRETKPGDVWMLKVAVWLGLAAVLTFFAGSLPIVGPMLALSMLPPNLFLLSAAFAVTFVASAFVERGAVRAAVFFGALALLGLNTRIPAFVSDMTSPRVDEQIGPRQVVDLSQPLHVVNGDQGLRAWRTSYDSASPQCELLEGCSMLGGMRAPGPKGGGAWEELPEASVKGMGFVLASPGAAAPTLELATDQSSGVMTVRLGLLAEDGRRISQATYRYRVGFPLEAAGDEGGHDLGQNTSAALVYNYLFHGNWVNGFLGGVVSSAPPHPVEFFLSRNFTVRQSQALAGGTTQVTLEVLSDEVHQPALIFKGTQGQSAPDPWPEKGWDEVRQKKCDRLLSREASAHSNRGTTQGWWLFVQDPTAQRKIRLTGNELCEDDAIWSFDYAGMRPRLGIKKYKATGELQYDLAVQMPGDSPGFVGRVRERTFRERDGYVHFESMDVTRPGLDLHVKRNMVLRFALPGATQAGS